MTHPTSLLPPAPFFKLASEAFGLQFGEWTQLWPLEVEVVDRSDVATWLAASYAFIERRCGHGNVTTAGGAVVAFVDCFVMQSSDSFVVQRRAKVLLPSSSDEHAFSTRFSLAPTDPGCCSELFMPGILYRGSPALAPPGSLAGDPNATHVLVRDDRMPLPLVMARSPESRASAELVHVRPNGSSFAGEGGRTRIVDGRMLFGSVGIVRTAAAAAHDRTSRRLHLAFQFPGSEGDRTYVGDRAPRPRGEWWARRDGSTAGWANRSHPLRAGFSHSYDLRVTRDRTDTYDEALQRCWRRAFAEAAPRPPPANASVVYRVSMDLLGVVGKRYAGVPSMPFRMDLAAGEVDDDSSQMGFVGKALPAAALLLHDALASRDAAKRAHAEAIVDFWVGHAMTASRVGVPQTWYNIRDDGSFFFRPDSAYMGHIRIMSEGMAGVLAAHALVAKPAWLACARAYGDFLLRVQHADGSVPMTWRLNGTAYDASQLNASDMLVPFLIALFTATGEERYRRAALRAGAFAARSFAHTVYCGGACDHPNVPDKEAAMLAMRAFLGLHELTADAAWLRPAARAATYAETFTYAWDVPLYAAAGEVYPLRRTTLGVSLIALGHSGADNFMAIGVRDFRRLGALLNDSHFARFGDFLSDATAQVLDWDGRLGYRHRGMMNEAISLAPPRGGGVAKWLPWLTCAVLEPMIQIG